MHGGNHAHVGLGPGICHRAVVVSNGFYDALVLGSGEGGKFMAWHLAKAGQRVAVIEDRYVGGSCQHDGVDAP